jgi:heptosyltransferase I
MPGPRSVLVIRLSSLGDVLMSMPAVKALKDRYPETRISWVVEGSVGELLTHQPFIDRVIRFPRSSATGALRRGNLRLAKREMGQFLTALREDKHDVIVDFHGIIKSAIFGLYARGRRIGFGKMYAKEKSHLFYHERVEGKERRLHKVERNMLLPRHIGSERHIPDITLVAPREATQYIGRFFETEGIASPVFAVNPFSSKGSAFKRWGIEKYRELIRRIRENGLARIVILWGPGEEEEARMLQSSVGEGVTLSCPTNVSQLLALLQRVDMYIGGDTGVMHLAAFAGTPVVAIFGPTDALVNGPYSPKSKVIRKDLVCSPCKNRKCEKRTCLDGISVDEVYDAAIAMKERIGRG